MTKIEWTNETWNPVTGCYGPGGIKEVPNVCSYCYAYRMARRLQGRYGYPPAPNFFKPTFHPDRLEQPLHWRKPRMVFVCSMADLFGGWVPDKWIERVFEVVRATPQHTYQFLTKNPERLKWWNPWPKNAWVGASATNVRELSDALRELSRVHAVCFISAEPWRENRNIWPFVDMMPGICYADWLIVGQQTGPGAKPPNMESIESLLDLADGAEVPVFIKPPLAARYPDRVPQWPEVEC